MRSPCVILTAAVTLLGGCGGVSEEQPAAPPVPAGDFGPAEPGSGERERPVAPPLRRPPAAVAAELSAGVVGVVGIDGNVGVRPRRLEVFTGGRLSGLVWELWRDGSALGRGRLRMRDCNPTCASGGLQWVPATVRLSRPRLCGRATYFDRAEVAVQDAAPPATYVRAPC